MYYWFINAHVNFLLKTFYHDSRPFAKYANCEAWTCSCEFGKPSGHAQMGVASFFIVLDMILMLFGFKQEYFPKKVNFGNCKLEVTGDQTAILDRNKENYGGWVEITTRNVKTGKNCRLAWVWFLGTLAFLLTLWVGASRLIRGVHSYNQIVLGWVWGINVSFLFWFNQRCIMDLIRRSEDFSFRKTLFIFAAVIAGYIGTSSMIFGILKATWKPDEFFYPYLNIKCDKCYGTFLTSALTNQSVSLLPWVVNLAWLLIPRVDKVIEKNLNNLKGRNRLNPGQSILRWLLFGLACIPFAAWAMMVGGMRKKMEEDHESGVEWMAYFMNVSGILLCTPITVMGSVWMWRKCGLDYKWDYPGFADWFYGRVDDGEGKKDDMVGKDVSIRLGKVRPESNEFIYSDDRGPGVTPPVGEMKSEANESKTVKRASSEREVTEPESLPPRHVQPSPESLPSVHEQSRFQPSTVYEQSNEQSRFQPSTVYEQSNEQSRFQL
jgi:membrane-associated phospholipid phosphatase